MGWDGMAVKSRQEGFCLSRLQSSEYVERNDVGRMHTSNATPVGSWNGKETCDFNVLPRFFTMEFRMLSEKCRKLAHHEMNIIFEKFSRWISS